MLGEVEERLLQELKDLKNKIIRHNKIGMLLTFLLCQWSLLFFIYDICTHKWFGAVLQGACLGFNAHLFYTHWRRLTEVLFL